MLSDKASKFKMILCLNTGYATYLISSKDLEAIARNTLKCGGIGPKIVSAPSESKDIDRVSIARKGIKKLIAAL